MFLTGSVEYAGVTLSLLILVSDGYVSAALHRIHSYFTQMLLGVLRISEREMFFLDFDPP